MKNTTPTTGKPKFDTRLLAGVLLLFGLLPLGCSREPAPPSSPAPAQHHPTVVTPSNHLEIKRLFSAQNYDWDTLHNGVPPLIFARFPSDFKQIDEISEKKRIFFLSLLPMVLIANEEIADQRERLLDLFERLDNGGKPTDIDRDFLVRIADEYGIERDPQLDSRGRRMLLERVDIIPPAMVLAQAATESGYGTSRYALTGNNLFGVYTFKSGTGMVPNARREGRYHEIRRFATLLDSVRFYMQTLNTHDAYQLLRRRRALHRALGDQVTTIDLTETLSLYSERGEAYVQDIRTMIRSNRLSLLTTASLRPPPPPPAARQFPIMADLVESRAD
ncbi:MAG: hypothetical protein A2091_07630 [Desulfuromonadales bacterium GWD2_61_12]|nr:MAG: hypothetical protein A2091_07630 [Desulfuromonadales bacterium GWD2_61_12]HBT84161.1 hypothetical protein [Desulfuromonas sp.]